jgi:hypothetical protein
MEFVYLYTFGFICVIIGAGLARYLLNKKPLSIILSIIMFLNLLVILHFMGYDITMPMQLAQFQNENICYPHSNLVYSINSLNDGSFFILECQNKQCRGYRGYFYTSEYKNENKYSEKSDFYEKWSN